jgi:hypothetical protein
MRFEPIDLPPTYRREQRCSFCQRPPEEAGPLVEPGAEWPVPGAALKAYAAICAECVETCRAMFRATGGGPAGGDGSPASGPSAPKPWWRFW